MLPRSLKTTDMSTWRNGSGKSPKRLSPVPRVLTKDWGRFTKEEDEIQYGRYGDETPLHLAARYLTFLSTHLEEYLLLL